ncbi:hypothetical protein HDA32_002348 [Spinactinospora alkalitolerans]|uniref:General stress protein 17M-like domain-containing protein n=1 Tax=Spinactinospora alkalitolerans TaxID=687207 RepID=A0A852TTI1_9ACTN|nr:general stress protein [Spinactinospora alkalitolerans]NYE47228.1 hypothetical protein [Spinactinospora alkalitolerans]
MATPVPQGADPFAAKETIGSFGDYVQAQAAVDYLSDQHFPVEHTAIVGIGVRWVEQITGRMTYLRAAGNGAAAGAWFGLLIGLFIALFTPPGAASWFVLILGALVWGVIAGAVFGLVSHAMQGGRRDFASYSGLQADHYDVIVAAEHAGRARELLAARPEQG